MPLYEYKCEGGHRFEEIHSIADRNNANCPDCKGAVHIVPSAPSRIRMAYTFTTYGHDGSVIGQSQSTEKTPILPEKVHGSRW